MTKKAVKKLTHKRLWILVSDEDREKVRIHAKRLAAANTIPGKVSINYAGAVIFHQAVKSL